MGFYYQSRGLNNDAEKSFTRALELDPNAEETLGALTQFYVAQKQTDRAIQRILSVPDSKRRAFHYELLGMVYSRAGRSQEAETAYKQALQKDPNRVSAGKYLAAHYIQTGRLDEGVQELDKLIKKEPSNAALSTAKAIVSGSQGKTDVAKESYSQALKADPTSAIAANNIAYILAEEGHDLETALKWAQTARKKDGRDPHFADTLGWIQHRLGSHILARDQLRFAVSKQPDNGVYQYHLGLIYKEMKQLSDAQTALKKAVGSSEDFKDKPSARAALKEIAKN